MSRSASATTEKVNTAGNLTSSFAQTEVPLKAVAEETAKDMIDSGMQASGGGVYKERNISVTEEDEPPTMGMSSSGDDSATMPVHKERYSSEGDADAMEDALSGAAVEEVNFFENLLNLLSFNSLD